MFSSQNVSTAVKIRFFSFAFYHLLKQNLRLLTVYQDKKDKRTQKGPKLTAIYNVQRLRMGNVDKIMLKKQFFFVIRALRVKSIFQKTIYRWDLQDLHRFLSFSFHHVYPENPVNFKPIIHRMPYGIDYPQHAIRNTNKGRRIMEIFFKFA